MDSTEAQVDQERVVGTPNESDNGGLPSRLRPGGALNNTSRRTRRWRGCNLVGIWAGETIQKPGFGEFEIGQAEDGSCGGAFGF